MTNSLKRKKEGLNIISQPIKGTAKRSPDVHEDEQLKLDLENDKKENMANILLNDQNYSQSKYSYILS